MFAPRLAGCPFRFTAVWKGEESEQFSCANCKNSKWAGSIHAGFWMAKRHFVNNWQLCNAVFYQKSTSNFKKNLPIVSSTARVRTKLVHQAAGVPEASKIQRFNSWVNFKHVLKLFLCIFCLQICYLRFKLVVLSYWFKSVNRVYIQIEGRLC